MSIGTTMISSQTILWHVSAEHGTAKESVNAIIITGGHYVATPTGVANNRPVRYWLDAQGYNNPHLDAFLLDEQTTATGSGTGTAKTGLGAFKEVEVLLDVTVGSGGTSTADRTLAVFLDSRLDGTNFINIGQFSGTGSVVRYAVHLSRNQQMATGLNVTGDAAAGTFRTLGWGDDIRVRRNITGTTPSFSYRVWVNPVS